MRVVVVVFEFVWVWCYRQLLVDLTVQRCQTRKYSFQTEHDQTGWPNEYRVCLPFWETGESERYMFEPWWSQTNDLKIDTCRFLAY